MLYCTRLYSITNGKEVSMAAKKSASKKTTKSGSKKSSKK